MDFVLYDHKLVNSAELNLTIHLLKESFFLEQKIWYRNNELPLFVENIELLKEKSDLFHLPWPGFMENTREILRLTKRLLNKNKFFRTGVVRMKLIWKDDLAHFLIDAFPSADNDFSFYRKGILLNFSELIKFSGNPVGRFDIFSQPLWDYAASQLKGSLNDNSVLVNEKESVCETIETNLFFLRGKSIITPSPATGCYIDTIRQKILESAVLLGYQVFESERITKEQVFEMDEAFLASEAKGMQWITGIENRRFLHSRAREINRKLNELLLDSVK